ncbi:hypothetical protein GCM10009785_33970 [Brooklawnia cerclae]|uniref:Uncharacterized protein n=1 Tax=Brooklawnia cerclae TaxID=349934 RepID=A0ABX0SFN6_9ACTN|nr:hypothetical protein [Brooklawnia cerclae]NIH55436.1 hypothetical protein [Brooklawnia cerclae]
MERQKDRRRREREQQKRRQQKLLRRKHRDQGPKKGSAQAKEIALAKRQAKLMRVEEQTSLPSLPARLLPSLGSFRLPELRGRNAFGPAPER